MIQAVARGGGEAQAFDGIADAEAALAGGGLHPHGIFLDAAQGRDGAAFLVRLRGDVRHHSTPIVWVAPTANEPAFGIAHRVGADDAVVLGDDAGVTRRVAQMAEVDPAWRPAVTQGAALVAHADLAQRRIVGRTVRSAGFDPRFAVQVDEAVEALRDPEVKLAVLDEALPGDGGLPALLAANDALPTILLAGQARLAEVQGTIADRATARALAEDGPAADLLFLANELLRPDVQNLRSSPRLLHATLAAFRPAGELQASYGYTYNLSLEGLYVRTLDAPKARSRVWLELRPPGERRAAHLRGDVVWRRGPQGGGGAAPPGFAVRVDPAACPPPDLVAYASAYDTLRGPG